MLSWAYVNIIGNTVVVHEYRPRTPFLNAVLGRLNLQNENRAE
jgi:hypothetical protein